MSGAWRRRSDSHDAGALAGAALGVGLLMILSGAMALTFGVAPVAAPTSAGSPLALAAIPSTVSTSPSSGALPGVATTTGPTPSAHPSTAPHAPPAHAGQIPPAVKAPPTVTADPATGNVSTTVDFSATGYADSSAFTLTYVNDIGTTVNACAGATTSAGDFSCTFVVPPMPAGAHKFTGTDAKGHSAIGTFTVEPQLIVTPARGLVGTPVTIQGTGFGAVYTPSDKSVVQFTVAVTWSQGTVCPTSGQLRMSDAGGFNCTVTIPALPAGAQTFVGLDNASNRASAVFTVIPGLTVGPTYGVDGTNVTFSGTGFAASSEITVKWTEGRACSAVSEGTGGFTCRYEIPLSTPGGAYTFTANDTAAHTASTPFTISFLSVAPASGPVGTSVTLTAGGFEPDDATFGVTWGATVACQGLATNAFGALTCTFTIPATVAGPHDFVARGAGSLTAETSFTVEPALVADPGYGESGTVVTFDGTGYAASSHVVVSWQNGSACGATTDPTGDFDCSATINATGGAYTFTGKDVAGDVGTTTYIVTYLALTPASGPYGTTLSVSGAGFAPKSTFTVSWGALTVCGGGKISSLGAFTEANCTTAFKVPYATAGPHLVVASSAGFTATAEFIVTPRLTFAPGSVEVGTKVVFTGTGYNATSEVTVSWADGTACTNTTAADGAFNCTKYTIPPTPTGSYLFTGRDAQGVTASATMTIGTALVVSPTSGVVNGTALKLVASGFAATSAISVSWNRGPVCNGTTNATGTFRCPFTVPPAPDGVYTFTATDASSDTASATFVVDSLLTENPSSGPVGTLITFQGTGFNPSVVVTLSWSPSGTSVTACTAESSPTGSFTCSFAVPAVPSKSGGYVFSASQGSGTTTVTFDLLASLSVKPTQGPVGTQVTFSGAGYRALYPVHVNWTGGTACSQTASTAGTFSCTFVVPATPYGVHTFVANDSAHDSARATFTVVPALTVEPISGPVGTLLEFNGTGFNRSSAVAVTWAAGPVCTASTSTAGSFQCTVSLPAATFGVHVFTATDAMGHTANATFSVTPQLVANPSSGLVGTTVTFAGTGFASSVGVTVTWASGTACSNTTTASGGFSCRYTIPVGTPGGVYPFTGADGANDTAIATFTVSTSLTVAPTKGVAGTPVTFKGSGYAASSSVSVTWSAGTACSTMTLASGTFSCDYTIPIGTAGGSYTFTATDGAKNTATTTFVVTFLSVNPTGTTAGNLVQLSAGGFTSNSSFSITWTGGTACSGTTTTLGEFSCSYTIPSGTAPGKYTFTGTDAMSVTATASFTVFGIPSVTGPVPNHPGADVGQLVSFSTVASGGSGTYSLYTWTESSTTLGCTLANAATISCTPTAAAASDTVTVVVTDSNGVVSSPATSAKFTVSPELTVAAPTINRTGVDVNQAVAFSASTTGGAGGLSFAWTNLPAGCGGTGATVDCSPTLAVSGAHISVTVTDADGNSVTSATLVLTVYSDPSVTTPDANRTSADVGQPVSFVTTLSGGSGGATFSWSGLPSGCSGTSSVVTCAPTAAGKYATIKVTVTDSNGFRATSAAFSFTVDPDPTVAITSPTHTSVDLGQDVTFTAKAGNGSGGFAYVWSGLPTGCASTAASFSCTPTALATGLSVTVTVTDSNGAEVISAVLTFSVYAVPVAGAPTPSLPGADLGETVSFEAQVTGGAPSPSFVWAGLPPGCGGTTAKIVCDLTNASAVGLYTISYTVTDSNGLSSGSSGLEFRFSSDPSVEPLTSSRSSADVGQPVTFTASASGGFGTLSYAWNGLPAGCSSTTDSVTCSFPAPNASASISVTVTDSNGYKVTSPALAFTIYARPTAGTPTASVASADVNQTVTFSEVATGAGSGRLTYTWSGLPGGCSGTSATVVCAEVTGPDTYEVNVTIEDSNGAASVSVSLEFIVYGDPTVTPPSATPGGADIGGSVTISVTGAGGSGGLTYSWSGLPNGCTGTTTATVVCKPTSTSATSITVTVTDSNGVSVTSKALPFTVSPALAVTVHSSPSSLLHGKSVTFTATVTGGSTLTSVKWSGLPAGCTAATNALTVSCTPSGSGSFTVSVTVTDSNGGTASGSTSMAVHASFLGLPESEGIGLLAAGILAALVAIVVVALLIRRRRRSTPPLPWTPGPSTPSAPTPAEEGAPTSRAPPAWSPPPAAPSYPEEPSPWELPPHEPGADAADEGAAPPDGA